MFTSCLYTTKKRQIKSHLHLVRSVACKTDRERQYMVIVGAGPHSGIIRPLNVADLGIWDYTLASTSLLMSSPPRGKEIIRQKSVGGGGGSRVFDDFHPAPAAAARQVTGASAYDRAMTLFVNEYLRGKRLELPEIFLNKIQALEPPCRSAERVTFRPIGTFPTAASSIRRLIWTKTRPRGQFCSLYICHVPHGEGQTPTELLNMATIVFNTRSWRVVSPFTSMQLLACVIWGLSG